MENFDKPLPLKQRTSSVDQRRDYTQDTWLSLLQLLKVREYFITVDNFSIWRRHLAWAIKDGTDLRSYMTQRYASNMVFMSLLLGAELNVLFNSDWIATEMRRNMREENVGTISFWVGFTLMLSVFSTILSLFTTFAAWGMVSAVSDENAHCVLRSSIGQYVASMPGRFIGGSIYFFMTWSVLYCFLLLPVGYISITLVCVVLITFIQCVVVFSAFGRLIMHTGAMGSTPIFDGEFERGLLPHTLHHNLLAKAKAQLKTNMSIMRQYRMPTRPLERMTSDRTLANEYMAHREGSNRSDGSSSIPTPAFYDIEKQPQHQKQKGHRRGASSVRFKGDFLASVGDKANQEQGSESSNSRNSTSPLLGVGIARDNIGSKTLKEERRPLSSRPPKPPPIPAMSERPDARQQSDTSIEEWLQGTNAAQPSPVFNTGKKTTVQTKFWSDRQGPGNKDNLNSTKHPPMDNNVVQTGEMTEMEARQNPHYQQYPPHPLKKPPSPPMQDVPTGATHTRNPSITSMLSDDDTFYREYGFNPDATPVMPSPSPPAGVEYSNYFDDTKINDKKESSEEDHLLSDNGRQGKTYTDETDATDTTKKTKTDGSLGRKTYAGDGTQLQIPKPSGGLESSRFKEVGKQVKRPTHVRKSSLRTNKRWKPFDGTG